MKEPLFPDNCHVVVSQHGSCKVCGNHRDLRMGACFDCASGNVCGEKIPGGHRLWQADKPENTWIVREN